MKITNICAHQNDGSIVNDRCSVTTQAGAASRLNIKLEDLILCTNNIGLKFYTISVNSTHFNKLAYTPKVFKNNLQ